MTGKSQIEVRKLLRKLFVKEAETIRKLDCRVSTLEGTVDRQAREISRLLNKLETNKLLQERGVPEPSTSSTSLSPIVLLASGGSSGSHLLSAMISRYRPFVTGPEANLAARPELFDEETYHAALIKGIMHSYPLVEPERLSNGRRFFLIPPMMFTNGDAYLVESIESKVTLLRATENWMELVREILGRLRLAAIIPDISVLIDHSPTTAVSSPFALKAYPKLKMIHLTRDPRDAIASMMVRRTQSGHFSGLPDDENMLITAKQWSVLTACALKARKHPGYLHITYEALVSNPEQVLHRVLEHLGYPDAEPWGDRPYVLGKMPIGSGWLHSPSDPVSAGSIGRFRTVLSNSRLKEMEKLHFSLPELGVDVSMGEYMERFRAPEV